MGCGLIAAAHASLAQWPSTWTVEPSGRVRFPMDALCVSGSKVERSGCRPERLRVRFPRGALNKKNEAQAARSGERLRLEAHALDWTHPTAARVKLHARICSTTPALAAFHRIR